MYDVDDEAVCRRSEGQWPGGHEQGDDVEQEGQVRGHVQRVVEGQHEQVSVKSNRIYTSFCSIHVCKLTQIAE